MYAEVRKSNVLLVILNVILPYLSEKLKDYMLRNDWARVEGLEGDNEREEDTSIPTLIQKKLQHWLKL